MSGGPDERRPDRGSRPRGPDPDGPDAPAPPTDFIGLVIAFVAIFSVTAIVILTTAVRRVTRRAEALDAMSAEQLRAEAESEPRSFRATADNARDVRIDPGEQAGGGRPA